MLTLTITPRAVLFAALLLTAGVLAFFATDALGSSTQVDAPIQGDTDCDGDIDPDDALNDLRYAAGLGVGPFPNCPAIGSVIDQPTVLFANVDTDGNIVSGDAISVEKPFDHIFRVSFAEDVSQCAATATPGTNPGGSGGAFTRAFATTTVGFDGDDIVRVGFIDKDNQGVSTDFHLIVVC